MKKIEGILVPLVTNFYEDECVDCDGIRENIIKLNASKLSGFFILGSNGEAAHLSDAEQMAVVKTACEAADPRKLLVAGITRQSAHATIEFGRQVQETSVDFFSVLTPSYFAPAMSDSLLIKYYIKVADALEKPVLIYNCPKFAAGITISTQVLRELAGHPNIAGMKDTSSMPIEEYLEYQTDDFRVVSGSINNFIKALEHGSEGGVLSMANYLPDEVAAMYEYYKAGKTEEALQKSRALIALNKEISGSTGVAGVKYACEMMGYNGGAPRSPLHGLVEAEKNVIRKGLAEAGYLPA